MTAASAITRLNDTVAAGDRTMRRLGRALSRRIPRLRPPGRLAVAIVSSAAGAALVALGAALVYTPAGYLAGGVMLLAFGLSLDDGKGRRR